MTWYQFLKKMNNREAHFYLEELQRMMTQHRGIFSEEFVIANGMAIQALERNITSDVVPVIRCKDCEHWDGYYCHHKGWGDGYAYYTPPIKTEDGFCDWAERKES